MRALFEPLFAPFERLAVSERGLVRRPFCGVRSGHRQTFGFGRPGDQANESNCNQAESFHVQRSLSRPHGPAKAILTKRAPSRKLK